jgi:3D-(3,5/4)-trihydroxycyclohexane-1,2-dione acylhydrolase (decyclizing)
MTAFQTRRLTTAQALIEFLKQQWVERDGKIQPFFGGCFGIFGHGNLAGIGQALQQNPDFRYYQCRNEQAMVHTATAYARMKNRLQTLACTSSIGPGATNMITGAALATINRLPVLLLPGDIFSHRRVAPVLQQLESSQSQDISVNDCFKPVSKYWDRINRPEQLLTALPEAMRVLLSPAETGTVTICLPQDIQAEAYNYPASFFEKRLWKIPRQRADLSLLQEAADWIRQSQNPIIIAGGGVIYSEATQILSEFVGSTGIAVCETQAGKGALAFNHPSTLGAVGVTGTPGANQMVREADLIIGIGTRYSDFTTASKTLFQNSSVRFININVCELDAFKHNALPLIGDAQTVLQELIPMLEAYRTSETYQARVSLLRNEWNEKTEQVYAPKIRPMLSQGEVIGALNNFMEPRDVVVCAAGSLPGHLHKLWRTADPKGYHVEYGYSCMGYEIAGGLGVKMADPAREVYIMVGDGSYWMMSQEIITAIQEDIKLIILLLDNQGFGSIGALSESLGSKGFGTHYRSRSMDGCLNGNHLPVDLAANAASMGAHTIRANTLKELHLALQEAKQENRTTVIVIPVERKQVLPDSEAWWDVPVAEVSNMSTVQETRKFYEKKLAEEVAYFPASVRMTVETCSTGYEEMV